MRFKNQAQRKAVMAKITARQFFIARFQRTPEEDKYYFKEWEDRFKTKQPESYMDSISKRVYNELQKGKQVRAIQSRTGKWRVIPIGHKIHFFFYV